MFLKIILSIALIVLSVHPKLYVSTTIIDKVNPENEVTKSVLDSAAKNGKDNANSNNVSFSKEETNFAETTLSPTNKNSKTTDSIKKKKKKKKKKPVATTTIKSVLTTDNTSKSFTSVGIVPGIEKRASANITTSTSTTGTDAAVFNTTSSTTTVTTPKSTTTETPKTTIPPLKKTTVTTPKSTVATVETTTTVDLTSSFFTNLTTTAVVSTQTPDGASFFNFNLNYLYFLLLILPVIGIVVGIIFYRKIKKRKVNQNTKNAREKKGRRFSTPSWVFSDPSYNDEEVITLEGEKR